MMKKSLLATIDDAEIQKKAKNKTTKTFYCKPLLSKYLFSVRVHVLALYLL